MIAAGLHGIDQELPLEPRSPATPTPRRPQVPHTLREAVELWEGSELAADAFGTEVVAHYANYGAGRARRL